MPMKRNNYLDKHILRLYELRTKLLVWGKCHHHQMWGSPHICSPHLFMHQFLSATHKSSSFTCFTAPFPISQDFKKNNTSGGKSPNIKKKRSKNTHSHTHFKNEKKLCFFVHVCCEVFTKNVHPPSIVSSFFERDLPSTSESKPRVQLQTCHFESSRHHHELRSREEAPGKRLHAPPKVR